MQHDAATSTLHVWDCVIWIKILTLFLLLISSFLVSSDYKTILLKMLLMLDDASEFFESSLVLNHFRKKMEEEFPSDEITMQQSLKMWFKKYIIV